jgi:DNA-binding response OmpR family regulator
MTILLIEDNRLFSDLIESSLSNADIHVVQTLASAQEWLSAFRADLILVDLGLPDSSGLDTLRALKGIRTDKVVLTGGDHYPSEVIDAGGRDYIPKTDAKDMLTRIRFHMERLTPRPRFAPQVFEQIKACLTVPERSHELIHA